MSSDLRSSLSVVSRQYPPVTNSCLWVRLVFYQPELRCSALALTHLLDKAKARYPWAKAWVQVRGGTWCFESEQEAEAYRPASFHEPFFAPKPSKSKR